MARSINLVPRCRETTPHQLINYKYSTGSSIILRGYKIEFRKEISLHEPPPFPLSNPLVNYRFHFYETEKKKKKNRSRPISF